MSGEQQGKGAQENCSTMWLAVSGFMVIGLVSGLSLASHPACAHIWPDSGPSWGCAHFSAKMNSSVMVSGRLAGHIVGWHLLPPIGPSHILQAGGSLSVPCSLPGSSVVR